MSGHDTSYYGEHSLSAAPHPGTAWGGGGEGGEEQGVRAHHLTKLAFFSSTNRLSEEELRMKEPYGSIWQKCEYKDMVHNKA